MRRKVLGLRDFGELYEDICIEKWKRRYVELGFFGCYIVYKER